MIRKSASFKIRGMQRDASDSAASMDFAFENMNMRVESTEDNTQFSLCSERGNTPIDVYDSSDSSKKIDFLGIPIGMAQLDDEILIFSTDETTTDSSSTPDGNSINTLNSFSLESISCLGSSASGMSYRIMIDEVGNPSQLSDLQMYANITGISSKPVEIYPWVSLSGARIYTRESPDSLSAGTISILLKKNDVSSVSATFSVSSSMYELARHITYDGTDYFHLEGYTEHINSYSLSTQFYEGTRDSVDCNKYCFTNGVVDFSSYDAMILNRLIVKFSGKTLLILNGNLYWDSKISSDTDLLTSAERGISFPSYPTGSSTINDGSTVTYSPSGLFLDFLNGLGYKNADGDYTMMYQWYCIKKNYYCYTVTGTAVAGSTAAYTEPDTTSASTVAGSVSSDGFTMTVNGDEYSRVGREYTSYELYTFNPDTLVWTKHGDSGDFNHSTTDLVPSSGYLYGFVGMISASDGKSVSMSCVSRLGSVIEGEPAIFEISASGGFGIAYKNYLGGGILKNATLSGSTLRIIGNGSGIIKYVAYPIGDGISFTPALIEATISTSERSISFNGTSLSDGSPISFGTGKSIVLDYAGNTLSGVWALHPYSGEYSIEILNEDKESPVDNPYFDWLLPGKIIIKRNVSQSFSGKLNIAMHPTGNMVITINY